MDYVDLLDVDLMKSIVKLCPIEEVNTVGNSPNGLMSEDSEGSCKSSSILKEPRACYTRRKTTQTWTTTTSNEINDGHAWRKYGQKVILNAKHPRNYYRCAHRNGQGCLATKQVQRTEEDPPMYQVTYRGNHSCKDPLKGPHIILDTTIPNDSSNSIFFSFGSTHYPSTKLNHEPSYPTFPLVKQEYSHNQHELKPSLNHNQSTPIDEIIDVSYDFVDSESDNFDDGAGMVPNLKDEVVDGPSSSCGNERIIVSTNNPRDRHDAALLPLVNMDTYINTASSQPIALPDGGEIVQLQSIEQKSLVDFDATNNRDQSSLLVSNSNKKYTREVSIKRCMTQNLVSLVESTRSISSTDFDSPDNREHLNSPIVFNSEKKDTRDAFKGECLTKNALSLDDSTKQNLFPDFDATVNKADLVEAYQSNPVVSLSENKNWGDALKRECIGKSILGLEDLRQHCGGSRDDAETSFGDSLAWMSFEALETLAPWEQPNDCVPLLSLGKSTLGGCVQQEKSPGLPRLMRIDPVGQRVTKSPSYLEGLTAQSASSSGWPIGLPDGACIVLLDPLEQSAQNIVDVAGAEQCSSTMSLPEKKMVRTLKRKYRTISVIIENPQQHQSITLPDGEIVELDSSVKKPLVDFDATTNREFQSGLLSYSKRRCMTLSGVSGFYRTDSLALKSFEVQETLHPLKQPRNSADTHRVRQIRTQMCEEPSGACGSHLMHMDTLIGRLWTYLCRSFCHSVSIFWEEPNDLVPLLPLRRLTFKGCVQLEESPRPPRLEQIDAVEQGLTKSLRYSGGSTAQPASSSCWPISLPDGGNVVLLDPLEQCTKNVSHAAKADLCPPTVSLPKKKMVRKSLKTKCRTMSLVFEDHRQHFGRKCEVAAKSLGATHICMKHGINRISTVNHIHKPHGIHWWPFRQKWARRKGYSLGGERTFEVSSLCVDYILDSRLLFIHRPQFARSSPPLALPDGGKIVGPIALSSSELDATNNKAHHVRQDQIGSTTSHYGWKNTRDTSERQGIAISLCSAEDLHQQFGCKHKDVVKRLGVNIPMFKSTCRQHRNYWQPCRIKNEAFDATNNRAHLVEADQSNPTVSNLEKETTRETSKRECITKCILISEDLRQHYGSRQRDAAKGLWDTLAQKSLEVLDVLPLWEESNTIEPLVPRRRLALQQRWIRPKKSLDLPRTLEMNFPAGLTAQSASSLHWPIGLPAGGHVVCLSRKIIVRKTFKRECRTISASFEGNQPHFGSRCEGVANIPAANRICEQYGISLVPTVKRIHRRHGIHRSLFRQSASHWPVGLPDGGHIVPVSTKKNVTITFKRKCRTRSATFEDHNRHFGSRCKGSANSLRAKHMCKQHGINLVFTVKLIRRQHGIYRCSFRRGFSFGGERPAEVISLMEVKLVSRLQFLRISWLARSSLRPLVFSRGSEIERHIAFASSEFAATNNRAHPGRQGPGQRGSSGSHPERERTGETPNSEGIASDGISFEHLQQHFGRKREDAARSLGISISTLKRVSRRHGIDRWPHQTTKRVLRPPDPPGENNPSPTYTRLSPIEQIMVQNAMGGQNPEPNEFDQDAYYVSFFDTYSGSVAEILSGFDSHMPACSNPAPSQQPMPQPMPTWFARAPSQQPMPQPMPTCFDLAPSQQPMPTCSGLSLSQQPMPTCFDPALSQQPMPTISDVMPTINMMSNLAAREDTRSVVLKITYEQRKKMLRFEFPLMSGIIELKEEVKKRLELELDCFDVEYIDDEGDRIFLNCDEDLRKYLQSNQVICRLFVVDRDANTTNFS